MKSAKVIFTYHVVHTQRTLSNVTTSVYGTTSLRLNNTNALCQTDQISSSQTELFIMPGKTPEKFQAFPFSPKTQTVPLYLPRCREARISPTWFKGKQILPGGEKADLANSSLLTSRARAKRRKRSGGKSEQKTRRNSFTFCIGGGGRAVKQTGHRKLTYCTALLLMLVRNSPTALQKKCYFPLAIPEIVENILSLLYPIFCFPIYSADRVSFSRLAAQEIRFPAHFLPHAGEKKTFLNLNCPCFFQ